jgi:drug/metabolite transporter (DMT)-like permease
MSLTPLALLGFGVMLGEETWSWPKCVAMLVGIVGLYLLFGCPTGATSTSSILGWTAVGWAALSSAWGSVIARPLISQYGSQLVAGSTTVLGGIALLLVGIAAGEDLTFVLPFYWPWDAIGAWIFLVVFGSLVGYSLYIQLIDDIGPARAGSFAFVSPMIAVAVGAVVAGETVSLVNLGGMVLMLLSAGACLHADAFARPKPAPTTG